MFSAMTELFYRETVLSVAKTPIQTRVFPKMVILDLKRWYKRACSSFRIRHCLKFKPKTNRNHVNIFQGRSAFMLTSIYDEQFQFSKQAHFPLWIRSRLLIIATSN